MDTLLSFVLGNAVMATAMAVAVAAFARLCRRPALVHGLWVLVLLKLITPSFWPVSVHKFLPRERPPSSSTTAAQTLPTSMEVNAAHGETSITHVAAQEELDDLPETALPSGPVLQDGAGSEPARSLESPAETNDPPPERWSIPWAGLCVGFWISGSLCWFALAGGRLWRFQQFLGSALPAPTELQMKVQFLSTRLGLRQPPQVFVLPAAVSPMLWALGGAPRLFVPASLLDRLNSQQWDTLLAHELAHLRRRDHWVRLLELLVLGLNWWHPVAWWARRELREAEEQCCDAWVVWALPALAEAYALALVETVTFLSQSRSALPLAASGIGQVHFLKRRLVMIMRGRTPRALSALGFVAVIGLGAVLLPLLPTWAQTNEPQVAGEEPPAAAPLAVQAVRAEHAEPALAPVAAAPDAAVVVSAQGVAQPAAGLTARWGDFRQASSHSETVEEARDEVELMKVQLDSKRAELREAQVLLKQAQRTAERTNRLAQLGSIDSAEADRARTELEVLEARLGGKEAQIRESEVRLRQSQRRLARLQGSERPRRETPREGDGPRNIAPPGMPGGFGGFSGQMAPGGLVPPSPLPPGGGGRQDDESPQPAPRAGSDRRPGQGMPGGMRMQGMPGMSGGAMGGAGGRGGMMPGAGGMAMGGMGGGMAAGGGRSGDFSRRLDDMEKRLDGLLKDVKTLKDLASAQSKQDKLLQDLARELRRLRDSLDK